MDKTQLDKLLKDEKAKLLEDVKGWLKSNSINGKIDATAMKGYINYLKWQNERADTIRENQ